jgi:hypothetical protein
VKTCFKIGLLIAIAFVLYWLFGVVLGKRETWVAPKIEGVIVKLEDESLSIAAVEVIARNPEVGDRRTVTDESGRFSFPAVLKMKRRLGDQCFSTTVSVTDFNGTVVNIDAGICLGELDGTNPPTLYTFTFRLATKHSEEASSVNGFWRMQGLRAIAVGDR